MFCLSLNHIKNYKISCTDFFILKIILDFSEYDVIQNIIENIDLNSLNLTIKLHPNERSNKFELLKKKKSKKNN